MPVPCIHTVPPLILQPPQSALGELVAKVEDMAQALMMVADKLNKRLNKVEKMMGELPAA